MIELRHLLPSAGGCRGRASRPGQGPRLAPVPYEHLYEVGPRPFGIRPPGPRAPSAETRRGARAGGGALPGTRRSTRSPISAPATWTIPGSASASRLGSRPPSGKVELASSVLDELGFNPPGFPRRRAGHTPSQRDALRGGTGRGIGLFARAAPPLDRRSGPAHQRHLLGRAGNLTRTPPPPCAAARDPVRSSRPALHPAPSGSTSAYWRCPRSTR